MATPYPLQTAFLGMQQDQPRDRMAPNVLWNCVDYIPEIIGAPLRKRGGWSYGSRALGASTQVTGLCFAPFPGGSKNIAVASTNGVYSFTTGAETLLGTNNAVSQNPILHRIGSPTAMAVIIPHTGGNTAPSTYDGTTYTGTMAGSPPFGIYADVWNDRTLLGNTLTNPNRLYFGPVGNYDPVTGATWDTTNSWQDFALPITGLAVLKNGIFVFHQKTTDRLRGTTPPQATTIGDLVQDAAFSAGCIDARTIAKYNDTVLWADARGVYQSDGVTIRDITVEGGLRAFWRNMMVNYVTTDILSAGIWNDNLVVSYYNASANNTVLVFDLTRRFWYRITNLPAVCFATVGNTFDETYVGLASLGRVASLSSMLFPDSTNSSDANATAVTPFIETPFYRGYSHVHRRWAPSLALQHWQVSYLDYLLTSLSLSPTMTIAYATDPTALNYTTVTQGALAESRNGLYDRAKRELGFFSSGVMFKVSQTLASDDTRLFGLECEYDALEEGRIKQ